MSLETNRNPVLLLLSAAIWIEGCSVEIPGGISEPKLTIVAVPGGGGRVTSMPGGIDCPPDCSASYPPGTSVVLTASAAAGFELDTWSEPCDRSSTCTVMIESEVTRSVVFVPLPQLRAIRPADGLVGRDVSLALFGSGFRTETRVMFAGRAVDTTFIDSGELRARVPKDLIELSGTYAVTAGTSSSLPFTAHESMEPFGRGRYYHDAVVAGDFVYVIGGYGPGGYSSDVFQARFEPGGRLGPWMMVQPLPQSRIGHFSAVVNNHIFVIGGHNGPISSEVFSIEVDDEGQLVGAWKTLAEELPAGRSRSAGFVHRNRIYVVGGAAAGAPNDGRKEVYFAEVRPDGEIDAWRIAGELVEGRLAHAAVVAHDYFYVIGGASSTVEVHRLDPITGMIIVEPPPPPINAPFQFATGCRAMISMNHIYVVGGQSSSGTSGAVHTAKIQLVGALADVVLDWHEAEFKFNQRMGYAALIRGSWIYVFGGLHAYADGFLGDVQRAEIVGPGVIAEPTLLPHLLPLDADADCTLLLGFEDIPSPDANLCQPGARATFHGMSSRPPSRRSQLGVAFASPDGVGASSIDTGAPTPAGDVTIEMTVRRRGPADNAGTDAFAVLYSDQDVPATTYDGVSILAHDSGKLEVRASTETTYNLVTNVGALPIGLWRHIAVTLSDRGVRLFIDGAEYGAATFIAPRRTSNRSGRLGSGDPVLGDHRFTGDIDEVRISRVVRY
jgi:hypothetical protein